MTPETADLINACFVAFAAVGAWFNVVVYARDRKVAGVAWPFTIGFSLWGVWNLLYYQILGQWVSFVAEIFIVCGNFVWVTWIVVDRVVEFRQRRAVLRCLRELGWLPPKHVNRRCVISAVTNDER